MVPFSLTDFAAYALDYYITHPVVIGVALFVLVICAWIGLVRYLTHRDEISFVRREVEREMREAREADDARQRKVYGAVHQISSRRPR